MEEAVMSGFAEEFSYQLMIYFGSRLLGAIAIGVGIWLYIRWFKKKYM